jgi:hypothetical protein
MFAMPSAQRVDSRLIPLYDQASPSLPRGRPMSRKPCAFGLRYRRGSVMPQQTGSMMRRGPRPFVYRESSFQAETQRSAHDP